MKRFPCLARLTFVTALALFAAPPLPAADHGDAPALAQDLGADIADVFAFQEPTDPTSTVLIATVHGFLVPGEVSNFAVFDPNIHYRFEIYNNHVNLPSPALDPTATAAQKAAYVAKVVPNRWIEVTFNKRQVGTASQMNTMASNIPTNLRRPVPQKATVHLFGFPGARNGGVYTTDNSTVSSTNLTNTLDVTPFGVGTTAAQFDIHTIADVTPGKAIQFFAGEVDDPFFFDIPAFTAFVDSVRAGTPSTAAFSRGRDTFAGYNVLAIALKIPTSLLLGTNGPTIGVDFLTLRPITKMTTNDGAVNVGTLKRIDRMGNPTVNVALIPFDQKNAYNSGSAQEDVALKFAGTITQTLNDLGVVSNPPEPSYLTLANIAVAKGDLLQLDTSIPNSGTNAQGGFPNGRRLTDDTVDIVLTTINHGNTLGDGVNTGYTGPLTPTVGFPYLTPPNQPLFTTPTDPEDRTRN